MSEILTDLSPSALAHAIKSNLYALYAFLQTAPQTDFHKDDKLIRWRTRVGYPWFNGVLVGQPAQAGDAATISSAVDYFKANHTEAFTWWVAPDVPLDTWEPLLMARGFIHDANTPGMALDLHSLPASIPVLANVQITTVKDSEDLMIWSQTFIRGYGLPPDWAADLFDLQLGLGLDWPMRNYLAWLDDTPVAASNIFLAAGVAGVFDVATVPEARGKGMGAAVTAAGLYDARALGYRVSTLQSSDLGFNVYHRLGFCTFCQMDHFYWSRENVT